MWCISGYCRRSLLLCWRLPTSYSHACWWCWIITWLSSILLKSTTLSQRFWLTSPSAYGSSRFPSLCRYLQGKMYFHLQSSMEMMSCQTISRRVKEESAREYWSSSLSSRKPSSPAGRKYIKAHWLSGQCGENLCKAAMLNHMTERADKSEREYTESGLYWTPGLGLLDIWKLSNLLERRSCSNTKSFNILGQKKRSASLNWDWGAAEGSPH